MSPIDCSARFQQSAISNASLRFFKLDTVQDPDSNWDAIIDGTESANGGSDDPVDWSKGWTCMDIPTSFNWQPNSSVFWQAPSGTW